MAGTGVNACDPSPFFRPLKMPCLKELADGQEVMILQEIDNEISARQWIDHPDAAAEWMSNAGLGAYPTQFVGRFAHLMSIDSQN